MELFVRRCSSDVGSRVLFRRFWGRSSGTNARNSPHWREQGPSSVVGQRWLVVPHKHKPTATTVRVLAETPGKVLRQGGVDVLDARSGAVSRPTVITSYSYCSHLHQMSIHLSCTETIIVICFRSVNKRQQLWRHPR